MADSYLYLEDGTNQLEEQEATVISTGVANAGDIVALDENGQLDASIAISAGGYITLETNEDVIGGEFINIYNDAGTPKIQLASASGELFADGFVKADYSAGDICIVYLGGMNTSLTGLTVGAQYFLSLIAGSITDSPPTGSQVTIQLLGRAISTTSLSFDPVNPIVRS